MTKEQKEKLEQAAKAYYDWHPSGVFVAGAQTILDNPGEWGLCDHLKQVQAEQMSKDNLYLIQENHRYRDVLERLLENSMCSHAGDELIEEALKQHDNEKSI